MFLYSSVEPSLELQARLGWILSTCSYGLASEKAYRVKESGSRNSEHVIIILDFGL